MGHFKTKKKKNNTIIYIGLFLISVAFSIKYLYEEGLIKNDTLLDILIKDNFIQNDINIMDVDFLLKYALNIGEDSTSDLVFEDKDEDDFADLIKEEDEVVVYIYNTHQEEKYKSEYLDVYNLPSTVLIGSKILKEYLEDLGIKAVVEENSITDMLHSMNLKYGKSYSVSRILMESAYKENPTLKYFIDFHRDSSVYEKTTTEIEGEKYAKILFVVGLDNENYEPNLKLAEDLSDLLESYNEDLVRGIMKKSGKGVNGVYNQDFNSNTMLIEVGGQYNNIREVNNTLKIFAQVLYDYIKENNDE